ncbi:5-hydroxytryptamine receptor 3A-like [Eublepharis macularius]|uniref:5-hydroxytryptamine receptor 3A-like n=1 Tax=Eublepharis macularius TaxID=481883 RepID=A0AA97J628_EUBMA|nr:5-hydroxytryptamine receptor 3A-like [Eublepharis macularius]
MEVTPEQICRYYDVAEHLNISANKELFLYTIPKRNWKEPLKVELDFTLVSILSVKEKLQVVTFYFWLLVIWKNEFISWNPSDFCNISHITLPANLFWVPDIFIDERADEDKFTTSPFLHVSYNGSITVLHIYRLTSSCNLDVHAFPFDEQKCNLTLMPSVHTAEEILLNSTKTSNKTNQDSRKNYLTSGEWKFENLRIIQQLMPYDTDTFSTVIYEISMTRRSILYVLVLIVPTVTLFLLDMAISFTAVSPVDMISFKVTLILEVSVLSLILNDMLPATSDNPPVIAMFFTGIFMFMVVGIMEHALIMYLKEKKPKLPFFKDRKCMSRFLREETEDPVITPGSLIDETSMENKPVNEVTLPETNNANGHMVLKQMSVELQQIRKHLVLERQQRALESDLQEKTYLLVDKGLRYIRLVLSICFLIFIIIKWRQ